ncbi:RHS repeat domain-containing protein, partial [Stenotrophomonas sp. S4]
QDGATGTPIETYAYDATGNRTALTTAAGTASYTYPATSHRLTAVDGEARTHDAAGNTTSIGSKTFTYNDANRMNAVKQGNAVLESYAYNHRGERVLRTPTGGATQITLYDEAGQWLGNYSATGQAQQQAIWLDNYPVALINVPATGVPELAYVQPDHLGTPRVVIDPVRNVSIWEWSNKSEVFGNQIASADPDGDGVAFELALRFPGQQATSASGLFYNYQREYDPAAGRYSQSDPLGIAGGLATYAYAWANPVIDFDNLGLAPASGAMADCLEMIFGRSVSGVDVRNKAVVNNEFITTRKNSIRLPPNVSVDDFFEDRKLVLHEYYHVIRQWNTGELSRRAYVAEFMRNGSAQGNKFEDAATAFAGANVSEFNKCIASKQECQK